MTFGGALRQELRSLALAQRVLADLPSAPGVLARLRDARLHVIGAEEEFRALKIGSHQDASWAFLQEMRELGHGAADDWLAAHLSAIGVRSTMDLADFAGPVLEPHISAQRADASQA
jgi:NTE family protein